MQLLSTFQNHDFGKNAVVVVVVVAVVSVVVLASDKVGKVLSDFSKQSVFDVLLVLENKMNQITYCYFSLLSFSSSRHTVFQIA